ncbi:hypothetical protein B0H10DRAFT_2094682 [Mycena sp. CBHHK59/15]|nr:hypothetical protein B0H10DRAFT_2094682 [Mycena sp. CBHHK59/15]
MSELNSGPLTTLRDRLRHNLLPSDENGEHILHDLATVQVRLSTLESEEGKTQTELATTIGEAAMLAQYISDCASLHAPIRLLRTNVLRTIFLDPLIHDVLDVGSPELFF